VVVRKGREKRNCNWGTEKECWKGLLRVGSRVWDEKGSLRVH